MRRSDDPYRYQELMACVFARELKNHTFGLVGAHSLVPMAACLLARELDAPDLSWVSGGSGYVNPSPPLVLSSSDYRFRAEAVLGMDRVLQLQGRHLDFFFAGGFQFDQWGATNLVGVPGEEKGRWKFRGPGTAGVPFMRRAKRVLYYTTRHSPRVLVPQVDYRSASLPPPTDPSAGDSPHLLVTPLAVFEFNPQQGQFRVKAMHPGVEQEELRKQTAFELVIPEDVPSTPPPTDLELELLREVVDPHKLLRRY